MPLSTTIKRLDNGIIITADGLFTTAAGNIIDFRDFTGAAYVGNGSPEGVQTALVGATYLDLVPEQYWFKKTGTGNTGWIALIT